eukprot:scaffold3178_cov282-Pinguiococcus_pyrenoidosus.AAC.7
MSAPPLCFPPFPSTSPQVRCSRGLKVTAIYGGGLHHISDQSAGFQPSEDSSPEGTPDCLSSSSFFMKSGFADQSVFPPEASIDDQAGATPDEATAWYDADGATLQKDQYGYDLARGSFRAWKHSARIVRCPLIGAHDSLTLLFGYSDDKLSSSRASVQVTVVYTDAYGNRRLRVHNASFRVTTSPALTSISAPDLCGAMLLNAVVKAAVVETFAPRFETRKCAQRLEQQVGRVKDAVRQILVQFGPVANTLPPPLSLLEELKAAEKCLLSVFKEASVTETNYVTTLSLLWHGKAAQLLSMAFPRCFAVTDGSELRSEEPPPDMQAPLEKLFAGDWENHRADEIAEQLAVSVAGDPKGYHVSRPSRVDVDVSKCFMVASEILTYPARGIYIDAAAATVDASKGEHEAAAHLRRGR